MSCVSLIFNSPFERASPHTAGALLHAHSLLVAAACRDGRIINPRHTLMSYVTYDDCEMSPN